jgi:hypothetical protein
MENFVAEQMTSVGAARQNSVEEGRGVLSGREAGNIVFED